MTIEELKINVNDIIITQNNNFVNININNYYNTPEKREDKEEETTKEHTTDTHQENTEKQPLLINNLKNSEKWREKKEKSLTIAEKLKKIGLKERGMRMERCGEYIEYNQCDICNHVEVSRATLCRDKLCSICSWRLSLQRYIMMSNILDEIKTLDEIKDKNYRFMTLTIKNCEPEQLSDTLKFIALCWNKLTAQRSWRKSVTGWAKSIEITYNKKTQTFHPHIHILLIDDNKYNWCEKWVETVDKTRDTTNLTKYISDETIKNKFVAAEKAQNIQEIRNANTLTNDYTKAILETFKYSVKSKDMEDMPLSIFKIFVQQIQNKRFIAFGGVIKEIKYKLNYEFEELKETEETHKECPCCNTPLRHAVAQWINGEYKLIE